MGGEAPAERASASAAAFHARAHRPPQGEAVVLQDGKEVNRLFKADFFGEQALLHDEPRCPFLAFGAKSR